MTYLLSLNRLKQSFLLAGHTLRLLMFAAYELWPRAPSRPSSCIVLYYPSAKKSGQKWRHFCHYCWVSPRRHLWVIHARHRLPLIAVSASGKLYFCIFPQAYPRKCTVCGANYDISTVIFRFNYFAHCLQAQATIVQNSECIRGQRYGNCLLLYLCFWG